MDDCGIIVGCDAVIEWILPWWWQHYSLHNSYPVAFINFGMTEKALSWCRERGTVMDLENWNESFFTPKEQVCPKLQEKWETFHGKGVWSYRPTFFKKPFAFLQSPFSKTLWIDLDCEIKESLSPLFHTLSFGLEIAIAREPLHTQQTQKTLDLLLPGEVVYNSGVVAFIKKAPILEKWLDLCIHSNAQFLGDQDALSRAIFLYSPPLLELPAFYNWSRTLENHPDIVIHHFHGGLGKKAILEKISANPTFFSPF